MSERQAFYETASGPRKEALAKIREEMGDAPRQPDEFTKQETAELLGISVKAAEYRLDKQEREGKVTSRLLKSNLRLYRWVE